MTAGLPKQAMQRELQTFSLFARSSTTRALRLCHHIRPHTLRKTVTVRTRQIRCWRARCGLRDNGRAKGMSGEQLWNGSRKPVSSFEHGHC